MSNKMEVIVNKAESIKICENHDYKVPLLSTFAFPGAEYWCPYCGYTGGFLGAGENVKYSKPLAKKYGWYKEYAKDFLNYQGSRVCTYKEINGVRYKRGEIPQGHMDILKKKADKFEYKTKAKTSEVILKEKTK